MTLLAQCDLKGADAWTVACECASLGDSTMLDDLKAGLKIHNNVALIYEDSANASLDRPALKLAAQSIEENHWQYKACKQITYGSFYGMAPQKMTEGILKNSYSTGGKPVYVAPKVCEEIQRVAVFTRYPGIKKRFKWYENMLLTKGRLVTEIGHVRTFHGRKVDWKGGTQQINQDTLREALATLPQLITTHVVKRVLHNCWHDPANYNPDGSLVVRPLLTVHDSFLSSFDETSLTVSQQLLKKWFHVELTITGIPIQIPASFTCGPSWAEQEAF